MRPNLIEFVQACSPASQARVSDLPLAPDDQFTRDLVQVLPKLRAFAQRLANGRAAGDDLVQSAVLRAWRGRAGFVLGTNIEAWLFRILRNQHASDIRRSKAQPIESYSQDMDSVPGPENLEARLLFQDLHLCINNLSDHMRTALVLVAILGWSYEAAAEHAECTVGAMKTRVFRARCAVRESMNVGLDVRGDASVSECSFSDQLSGPHSSPVLLAKHELQSAKIVAALEI